MGTFSISVCQNEILNYRYVWKNLKEIMALILMDRVGF